MSTTIKDLLGLGTPFLRQYLEEQGIKIVKKGSSDFFRCINPDHNDNNPSCGLLDEFFHCFSCNVSGDIYNAAHFLEQKPLYGSGFIKDNVYYILNKYDVEFDEVEFTEDQLNKFKYEQVYDNAIKLFSLKDKDTGKSIHCDYTFAKNRGWTELTCKNLGIGTIIDFDKYISDLSKLCLLSPDTIRSMGINERLFGPNFLTFSIKDYNGTVRGFASRDMTWTKDSDMPKYINTSVAENPYYRKDQLLFGLDISKKYKDLRLDIFEGYGSLVTAQQAGIRNCCAIGGTALTENHVDIIRHLGFKHINLVLDLDATGLDKMNRYIDKFSGYNGLEVTIMHLPISKEDLEVHGQNDPDFFINSKKYGPELYRGLKPIDVFEHMISKYPKFNDSDPLALQFCKKMIPLIINQPDHIRRGKMISTLANHTGTDKEDIKLEIQRLEKTDVKSFRDEISRKIKNASNSDQIHDILNNAISSLEETSSTKKDRFLVSIAESIEVCEDVFRELNTREPGLHGWDTGFDALNKIIDGIHKPGKTGGKIMGFAGAPQHNKSTILLNVSMNIALNNDDVCILFWAIDDNRKTILTRLLSMISEVPIRKITRVEKCTPEEQLAINSAQDTIRQLTLDRKLIFKDDKFGRSKSKVEAWIKDTQDNSGKDIILCIDSLNNISGGDSQDIRSKIIANSTWAKALTASVPCSILATIELVKNRTKGVKPTLQEIAESAKLEYDFDVVGICWNEAQGSYLLPENVSAKWGSPNNWKPIVELDIQKNKAGSGEKGSIFFRFEPSTTKLVSSSRFIEDLKSEHSDTSVYVEKDGTIYNFERKIEENIEKHIY